MASFYIALIFGEKAVFGSVGASAHFELVHEVLDLVSREEPASLSEFLHLSALGFAMMESVLRKSANFLVLDIFEIDTIESPFEVCDELEESEYVLALTLQNTRLMLTCILSHLVHMVPHPSELLY